MSEPFTLATARTYAIIHGKHYQLSAGLAEILIETGHAYVMTHGDPLAIRKDLNPYRQFVKFV